MSKKDLKLNIKNTQLAKALKLEKLKDDLAKKKTHEKKEKEVAKPKETPKRAEPVSDELKEEVEETTLKKRRARSKSVFAPKEIKDEEVSEVILKEERPIMPEIEQEVISSIEEEEVKLGPTGRHVKDLLPTKTEEKESEKKDSKLEKKPQKVEELQEDEEEKKDQKKAKFKEFRDLKPARKQTGSKFDSRDRQGLSVSEDDKWRKARPSKNKRKHEEAAPVIPSSIKIRIPIIVKDLAGLMQLKASQIISKLFLQGMIVTINDILEDETTIQLIGHEFGCEISIDTSEEEKIRITDQTIKEEISSTPQEDLVLRPPVVAFMGHVDHGKTSLIDYIRKSNIAAGEAGAITQHIGAFKCHTDFGDIAILDTPGHEAFSAMRARGADLTDIVVLVVAGDEGIKAQTKEAILHAKAAGVTIVVAINKSDKPNFNPETVYRQLSDEDLLPEPWGGQTITVNCSAVTGDGIKNLLEMLALQAEVLELKASPGARARGTVLESELHKGMGAVATVLVQNGTLLPGDAIVFGQNYGRVKTMRDEHGKNLQKATPSTPVEITGLSGIPEAGDEFIVVKNEQEAKRIAEARVDDETQTSLKMQRRSLDKLMEQAKVEDKKILNLILRADVQGSVEALKAAILRIESDKIEANVVFTGVGEITESDVQLAAASNAVIIGFHSGIETHVEQLVKQHKVQVHLHDVIYHAIDEVKGLMTQRLDKISKEEDRGTAEVKATFKSSQHGVIAGCLVTEGSIHRNHHMRVVRDGEVIWKGSIASIKRVQEDVREVQKGLECGIVLANNNDIKEGDILQSYEVTYMTQEL